MKTYTIAGKKYTQKPLVLGQYKQLIEILDGAAMSGSVVDIVNTLGDKLPLAAAVVLSPDKNWPFSKLYEPKRKNIKKLAKTLADELDIETAFEVMADFFTCNPVQQTIERLTGVMAGRSGLKPSPSTSQEET